MVELPLQNVKATAVLEVYRETHVTPFARARDECKNKLKCRIEEPKGNQRGQTFILRISSVQGE